MEAFAACFSSVEDPRAGNARHDLVELMFVAVAAVLCGAEDCTDMADFARAKLGFLQQVVKLEHGPPSHDTFSRVFRLLAPEPFEPAFARFTAGFAGALEGVVAIDGKALRGAYERAARHARCIWSTSGRLWSPRTIPTSVGASCASLRPWRSERRLKIGCRHRLKTVGAAGWRTARTRRRRFRRRRPIFTTYVS